MGSCRVRQTARTSRRRNVLTSLNGKVAVVTGGTQGLGAAITFDQAVWGAYGSTPHPDAPL